MQMMMMLIALLSSHDLGAGVVCAEAGGATWEDRVAVAAVIRNRVMRSGQPPTEVMLARYQFAKPCGTYSGDRRQVTFTDRAAYAVGLLGLHRFDWITSNVVAFCTPAAARRVAAKWRRRGLRIVPKSRRLVHLFWSRK